MLLILKESFIFFFLAMFSEIDIKIKSASRNLKIHNELVK